ncbi:MAG: hypothetical protein ACYC9P_03360, partial [Rudaea sp.]
IASGQKSENEFCNEVLSTLFTSSNAPLSGKTVEVKIMMSSKPAIYSTAKRPKSASVDYAAACA